MNNQTDRATQLQYFEGLCRDQGVPLTWQRRVLFEALLDRQDHPTADQLYEALYDRVPGLSRTTVYRVLDTLVRLGVATRASHPGSAARFDPVTRPHHHLLCRVCDRLLDVDPVAVPPLPSPLPADTGGFEITDYTIYFRGTCSRCRELNPEPKETRS